MRGVVWVEGGRGVLVERGFSGFRAKVSVESVVGTRTELESKSNEDVTRWWRGVGSWKFGRHGSLWIGSAIEAMRRLRCGEVVGRAKWKLEAKGKVVVSLVGGGVVEGA
jgi:hypothetical protein